MKWFQDEIQVGCICCFRKCISFWMMLFSMLWVIGETLPLQAQEPSETAERMKKAPRVFIDCDVCDLDFIRTEIPFVNYVRDPVDAQVHVLVTWQLTGSGGKEYTLTFLGKKDFAGKNDTLRYVVSNTATSDEIRKGLTRTLKIGLVRYVAFTPVREEIQIGFRPQARTTRVTDKWKNWVFRIHANTFANGEKSSKSLSLYGSVSASKVTPEWKIRFSLSANYNENRFEFGKTKIFSYSRGRSFSALVVRSLGEHWSVAVKGGYSASTYQNIKHQFYLYPAVEFNIFPYSESTHRELRLQYWLRGESLQYMEETIFDRISETPFSHMFSATLTFNQPWGSTETTLTASQYWHDLSKNRLVLYNRLTLRVFGGLSINIFGSVSMIHDQLYLPKRGATQEEVLLRRKELATTYSYFVSFGITYTFGSIFSNVVNPRFGSGGGMYRIIVG